MPIFANIMCSMPIDTPYNIVYNTVAEYIVYNTVAEYIVYNIVAMVAKPEKFEATMYVIQVSIIVTVCIV